MKPLHILLALAISALLFIQLGSYDVNADTEEDDDDDHGYCMGDGWGGPW